MTGYGFLIGVTSSLMGVSGGSVSNMIQTLYGKPLHNAVATSAGLGVPITIAGTIGLMLAGCGDREWPGEESGRGGTREKKGTKKSC